MVWQPSDCFPVYLTLSTEQKLDVYESYLQACQVHIVDKVQGCFVFLQNCKICCALQPIRLHALFNFASLSLKASRLREIVEATECKDFLFYQRKRTLHFCNMMSSLTAVAAEVTAHKRSLVWCNVYMREGKLCFSNANAEVYLADK